MSLPHELNCFDPSHIGVWFGLERFRAERAAESHHPLAVLNAGEPFAARDDFFADSALDVITVDVAGVVVIHKRFFVASICSFWM